MAQSLIQIQTQKQTQTQHLSQQQLLVTRLVEKSLEEMEEEVDKEVQANPYLEKRAQEKTAGDKDVRQQVSQDFQSGGSYFPTHRNDFSEKQRPELPDSVTFSEYLLQQAADADVTPHIRQILEYLIHSLESSGLLLRSVEALREELTIYEYIEATEEDILQAIEVMQDFEPAGVGARSLQECLLLQLGRMRHSRTKDILYSAILDHYDEIIGGHWGKVALEYGLTEDDKEDVAREFRRLNLSPGHSFGSTDISDRAITVTPDFRVSVADDTVSFELMRGNLPDLYVPREYIEMEKGYRANPKSMSRQDKEALQYLQGKIEKARNFIEAIRQRRQTLSSTMKAIVTRQKRYFLTGDDAEIRPMKLEDIAKATKLALSTISRVTKNKYADTPYGIIPLKHLFSDAIVTQDGKTVSTRRIKTMLGRIIEAEDKSSPMSDEALAKALCDKGLTVARRTVAKYREELGIPTARIRKA